MDLSLNEIQVMLADSIDKFISNDYDFESRQKYAGRAHGYSDDVWRTFSELGWTSIMLSEEDGGFGGGPVGKLGEGHATLKAAVHDATLAVCAEAVGIMTVLTEKTIEYAKGRVQFGVPISSFQALQHRMVEMYTACEQSRSLLMWAAMMMADGDTATDHAVHSIKYQIGIAGKRVGEDAVQIHGGMGVTWELDVSHYFKRLTAIALLFGNSDWHLDQLALPTSE